MLSHLKLQDLILIEKADIEFGGGLNIFTGETGSGKSAILTAIRLIAGERADVEWIRAGAAAGIVEAKFTTYSKELFAEIDPPPPGEPLTVRREIHRTGKSRSFYRRQPRQRGRFTRTCAPLVGNGGPRQRKRALRCRNAEENR